MAKKDNFNNNDPISKAVDLLLENTEDLTTVFKPGGLYKELTKRLVEKMLNSEMQNYLGYEKNQHSTTENARNGTSSKKLITQQGKIEIDVPRDRNSNFTPVIVPKRQRRFDGFDQQVLSLYAKGMTLSDIRMQLQELYHGADISESVISQITDDVIDDVKAWQNRPLESIYPIVYFDCIVVKVRQDKRIINKSVYIALGVDLEGKKDVLGLWISENEGSKFWLSNFTEMKNRGLNDILIACSDNLTGMSEAIQSVYPKTEHQLCIVHQIRNSLKYVSYKHRKGLVADLKPIYSACSEEQAMQALESFESKWNKQYPQITKHFHKGDYTHAPTCDFSAKQQKRITTNENEITKLNTELIKANENINDVKNNWFNIETSPLWKKVKNENIKIDTWYIIDWTYYFIDSKQLIISNNKLTKSNIRITNGQIEQKQIIIENIDVNIDKVTLLYDVDLIKFIITNSTKKYTPIIHNIYQYQGTGTPTEFIAEENTERDYYTKIETNNLLDKKQDKLIAGTNITIDENNKISATGGKVDLSDYYKKEEVDKKLEDTKAQFPIAFQINAVGQEIPNLETTNKTVAGAINENKSNIDKKQEKENWKIIGKSLDNRTSEDFALSFNKYYRVFITWDKPLFNQTSVKLKIEFKSSSTHIGGDYMLIKGKIDNEDSSLIIKLGTVDGNKSQLIIIGGNKQYGNIFSLEELQDTIKIDIQPKLKINSRSLETNEIEENIWDIELKDIPPTPSPSGSNWKEVGTREKNKWDNWQITYDFQENKHYRVYYSWSIYNPVYTIQEFIITDKKIAGVQIQTFNDSANIVILSVQHAKWITIYTGKGNLKGNVWKLEELQE